ncbi:centromere protein V-like [Anneissia japonica]|uniref:centromere protein V-like n=1 Tax=Anneissia japonica TaxID=1529436 RepID=UPI0014259982|nr:centromere protein V-like [Anneissia japonica]XP_033114440.1 centromere protein V-like [Anneissia japonica]
MSEELVTHLGGCHCGAVKFQVQAPKIIKAVKCNCSICDKKQNIHFIVPNSKFKLLQGEDQITCYTFNTHKAKHTFCKICGVQSFYTPRSNPDGKGIMPHCLEFGTVDKVLVETFDGQNWEKAIEVNPEIQQRSKES